MTKRKAVSLIKQYTKVFKQNNLPDIYSELYFRYLSLHRPSKSKTMRWLGFAQGVAVAKGLFTLAEVKDHSSTGAINA